MIFAFSVLCVLLHSPPPAAALRAAPPAPLARIAQAQPAPAPEVAKLYDKREAMIPMRDGIHLFTAIYTPKDHGKKWPFLLRRTPYSCRPYGEDKFPETIGPGKEADRDLFIMVVQDVRGCFMSEGDFVDVRPSRKDKSVKTATDESTDTYDTIEWLVKNVENNNGKAGLFGISYPGFYAAYGMIDAHPALRAVSPQAPIADWFFDDFHHHGAFFLPHFFNFYSGFGHPRKGPTKEWGTPFDHGTPDGYQFFLDLGPLSNVDAKYYKGSVPYWLEFEKHPNRDEYWQERDLRPRLTNVAPAVLTVGGWFDAEDLFGALHVYRAVEAQNDGIYNALVMGPWVHGGWSRTPGESLGAISFGAKTSEYYRTQIELPFFKKHLKGEGDFDGREAYVFETGENDWHRFDTWPPKESRSAKLFLRANGMLTPDAPNGDPTAIDTFVSDPSHPVPYTQAITIGMDRPYMVEDQRFASRRQDVLTYATDPLEQDLVIAGPLSASLYVATTQDDADWIVKLIDVLPPDTKDVGDLPPGVHLGGYEMMVRSEAFRGRFREDYAHPKPFTKNTPTLVRVPLQDVLHRFKKGHRVMIQVQSTWFPLIDRNPQHWVDNIFEARPEDFQAATHFVYHAPTLASVIEFSTLDAD